MVFQAPPKPRIVYRLAQLGQLLGREPERSALGLRRVLGPVRLIPVTPEVGSNSLRWWRRGESNPRPKALHKNLYMLIVRFILAMGRSHTRDRPGPDALSLGREPGDGSPSPVR